MSATSWTNSSRQRRLWAVLVGIVVVSVMLALFVRSCSRDLLIRAAASDNTPLAKLLVRLGVDPSNYFYRVSPANARLKKEPAYSAKLPEYPPQARRQQLTGSGVFALHVRADGSIARVEVIRSIGHELLDRAAIAAFQQWRFRPGSIQVVRVPNSLCGGASPPRRA